MAVKVANHLFADGFPASSVAVPLFQKLQDANDVGGRDEAAVGLAGRVLRVYQLQLLRWHAPVSVSVLGDDAVHEIILQQVLQPPLDIGVRPVDGIAVAVLSPQHVATEGQRCRPSHIVVVVVPIGRGHVAEDAVLALRLADVAHPFVVEALVVEDEALAETSHRAVA